MVDKMISLHDDGTWEMVLLPFEKSVVGCRWVFTVKYLSHETVELANGYTHDIDYAETLTCG